jgi:uncharacterized protein YxjI
MGDVPAAPTGFTRYLMKSKFGAGRDFAVLDPDTEAQLFFVDGKLGPRPKAEVQAGDGSVIYSVKGQLLGIPKKMSITDASGTEVASLKAKAFSIVKDKMTMQMANGEPWQLTGQFIEKNYTVTSGGRDVVRITQKWVTVRDKYTVDVADGADPGLAFAIVWAVDRWVERD